MGNAFGWPMVHDMDGWMRMMEKRMGQQEARPPSGIVASDIEGGDMTPPDTGGGGDIDGGNDDDGFVLPTMSEFVIDGDPDFWVDSLGGGTVYTEDEAYAAFDNPYLLYASASAGTVEWDTEVVYDEFDWDAVLSPAWAVPLLGQDEKVTVDSATVAGLSASGLNSVGGSGVSFGSMTDDPSGSRYWSMINHFLFQASFVAGSTVYDDRTWYEINGNGDFPMPASSETETFPISGNLYTRGIIVVHPLFWSAGTFPVTPSPTTSSIMTGIRMEQA